MAAATFVSHIYQKAGVHTRDELLDMLRDLSRQAAKAPETPASSRDL